MLNISGNRRQTTFCKAQKTYVGKLLLRNIFFFICQLSETKTSPCTSTLFLIFFYFYAHFILLYNFILLYILRFHTFYIHFILFYILYFTHFILLYILCFHTFYIPFILSYILYFILYKENYRMHYSTQFSQTL